MPILTELEGAKAFEALKANPALFSGAKGAGAAGKGVAAKGAMVKGVEIEGIKMATAGKGAALTKTMAVGGKGVATTAAKSVSTGGALWSGSGCSLGLGLGLGAWGPVLLVGVAAAGIYGYIKSHQQGDNELADDLA